MTDIDRARLQDELLAILLQQEGLQPSLLQAPPRPVHLPLSFAQERLWFLYKWDTENPVYNMPAVFRLTGQVRRDVLERTFEAIIRRHEVLRTTFAEHRGQAVQVIAPAIALPFRVTDLSGLPSTRQRIEVDEVVHTEARTPFCLESGPLLRVHLVRLSPLDAPVDEYVLLLTMHHSVSDGWSMDILAQEFCTLYAHFCHDSQAASPLPELSWQYADFALWQRAWFAGEVQDTQERYWKAQLAGAPPLLTWPTDHPRPAVQRFHGRTIHVALDPAVTRSLARIGQEQEASLFMTLLSAFAVLLNRYTDQDDLVIGSPIANRTRQEFEPLIGYFANTLALRVDLSGNPSFVELLQRVRRLALDAYTHQDMPFERLVDALAVERDLRHTPVTQVVCALQHRPRTAMRVPDMQIVPIAADNHTSKFDLSLLLEDTGRGVQGDLEFNADLFEPAMMTGLLEHFGCLLEGIARNSRQRVARLPLLREPERARVLSLGQPAPATYVPDACLHTLYERQAALRPDAVAVVCGDQQLTYGQLNEQANQLAHYLRRVGVGPESLVGLYCERSCELVVGLLGILKAGGAYVPVDLVYPPDRIAFMLADGGVAAVVTVQALTANLPPAFSRPVVCLDRDRPTLAAQPRHNPVGRLLPANAAYVIFTSGSTGLPKGVVVTHDNVVRLFRATQEWYRVDHRDVWTLFHSPAFDFSVWEVWGALLYGGRLVVIPYLTSRSPEAFYELLHREHVTVLNQTPSAFRQLIEAEASVGVKPLALRFVVFGGEALDVRSLRPWFERHGDQAPQLINMYGITETTVHVTYRPIAQADLATPASVIGVPIPDLQLYLLDRSLEPVPSGVAGEIYVGGAGVGRGYLGRSDLTAERMLPDPFSNRPGARLYRSGDLARYRADGELEYLGRSDQQVKIRGFRVELGEIEALLTSHPSVRETVVIAWEKAADDKRLVAYVVATPGSAIDGLELRRFLKAHLPDYMVPAIYVPLEAIPLTSNGKINTRALPLPQQTRTECDLGFAAPRSPIEQQLAEIWAQALGVKQVGIHDGFFDLGGDSIRSIRVLAAAKEQGLIFSLQQLFQHQTIAELAQVASVATTREPTEPAVTVFGLITPDDRHRLPPDVVDAYPLTRLQAGMLFHTELHPAEAIYHDVFSYHLRAPLNLEAFHSALQTIVDRHPILRTSFALTGFSQPLQLVHERVPIHVPVEDLHHLPSDEQVTWVRDWIVQEQHHQFDWAQAPLLRLHICRRSTDTFSLGISFHHALLDGWSLASLLTELFQQYFLLMGQQDRPLTPLRASQFRDFVACEQQALRSETQRQHWSAYLQDVEISRVRRWPQPAQAPPATTGNCVDVPLTAVDVGRVKHVAETAGVPLKSVLFAAHLRVLQALTNRRDVLTGLVTNARLETEGSDRVAGLFLNTLPVRFSASDGSWLDLARAAFQAEQQVLPFRWYPFAEIQQAYGHERLLETAFNFIHFHVYQDLVGVGDVELLGEQFHEQTDFPLIATFQVDPFSEQWHLTLYYDPARFGAEQIGTIGGYYARALRAMADAPEGLCADHPILSPDERHTILVEWNQTGGSAPGEQPLHQWFEACAARTPGAPAVRCEGATLTYAELNARANQVAHHLRDRGVVPDVIVGLCVERSLDLVVGMLGILKAGGAYLPLDHQYPRERLAFMLADAQVPIVVTHSRLLASLPADVGQVVCLDTAWSQIGEASPENPGQSVQPEHLAYVLYTSGSTGTPKGVMIPHRSVCNHMAWMADAFPLATTDKVLQKTPASFDASVWEFYAPLLAGAELVMARPGGHQDPGYLVQTIRAEHITILQLVPSFLHVLLETPGIEACTSLRRIFCGGEALSATLRDRALATLPADLYNLYGPTEATIDTISWHCRRDDASPVVPLGRPVANTQVYILDDRFQPVPPGVVGELYLGGESLGRGYLHRPDLTAASFLPNPFYRPPAEGGAADGQGSHRLYRTGDQACYGPDGTIEFAGRADQQVKVRGFRIELGEIEAALGRCPGVRNGVVLARADRPGDQRLVAYLEAAPGTPFAVDDARKALQRDLPAHMIPTEFVVLPELPRTPSGKIDRRALPAPDAAAVPLAEYVAPRTLVEDLLAAIWADVLGLERVSVQANFFELGGHSLLATQVVSRARETFEVDLPLWNLFETPTIAGLAETIQAIQQQARGIAAPPIVPVPRTEKLPLSFAQERLWFLEQLAPGNPFYNTPATLRFTGQLDCDALERSLNVIVERHEALRTVFVTGAGQPEQVVCPFQPLSLRIIDLQHLSEPHRTAEASRVARDEAQGPFDLERGPLLRAVLLRVAPNDHLLVLTMHHIVSDAWSIGVFLKELSAHYNAYVTGQQARLPTLPIQYADFAAWQRQWLSGEVLGAQLAYWKEQLRGASPVFELPADHPRPSVHTFRGQAVTLRVEPELVRQLRVVSQQAGVSLYMTLLAAFAVLLSRSTWGVDDVVIGAPIANRTRRELEALIGFFVNIIPLRVGVPGNPLFTEVLRRVRHVALDAYAHQDLPFEQLVQELQPERDMTRNPLVQVSLAYHNVPLPECELAGVRLTPVEADISVVRFDLEVHLWDTPDGGLRGPVVYYADIFEAATIQRFVTRFLTLLAGIAADPHQAIAALPLCPDAERERVLVAWNQTAQPLAPDACLHALIESQVDRTPAAVAVRFENRALTYLELDRRANQLARHLQTLGVGPDVVVALCLERSLDLVIALLGVLKAGGAYLPLDPDYPDERMRFVVTASGARVALTVSHLRERLPAGGAHVVCVDADWPEIAACAPTRPTSGVRGEHLAYVLFTSGSTGAPKGVMIPHRAICNHMAWMAAEFPLQATDAVFQKTPYGFDASVWEFYAPLMAGAQLVMARPGGHQDPTYLVQAVQAQQVTILQLVPSVLQMLLDTPGVEACTSLRRVFCGGEALSASMRDRFFAVLPADLSNLYGPTEATIDTLSWRCARDHSAPVVPIGRPVANTQVYVLDRHLQPVPIGVPGELYLGGASLARGYLGRPDLTAERFVPHPFDPDAGQRVYRSGDLARYLPNGDLEYLGRIDHQVKLRGFRIELEEIETTLARHPGVRDACVLLRADQPTEPRLVAYVVPHEEYARALMSRTSAPDDAEQTVLSEWVQVFEQNYGRETGKTDLSFDISGWNSSYTGQPIPAAEMRVWVDQTVARILALQPRRVLEVGCGTGLLLAQIAPTADAYWGLDFADSVLQQLQHLTEAFPWGERVTLLRRTAEQLDDLERCDLDTVILNSVIQYFPSVEYLLKVLTGALALVQSGGHVFIGDVRSLPLLETYHASVQAFRAPAELTLAQLRQRIRQHLLQEGELVVEPEFFLALSRRFPEITDVRVELKRGQHDNELTRFRYDVTLTIGTPRPPAVAVAWTDWTVDGLSVDALQERLRAQHPDVVGIRNVPNARLAGETRLLAWVHHGDPEDTLAEFRRQALQSPSTGIDPEDVWQIGATLPYDIRIAPTPHAADGRYDVLCCRRDGTASHATYAFDAPADPVRPWGTYANNRLQRTLTHTLVPELRACLQRQLPDYMVPAAYVLLDALPLTASGKLDRRALPAPETTRDASGSVYEPPRDGVETELAAIWADTLGLDQVGVHDNFFALGGDSILSIQIVAKARQRGLQLTPRDLFQQQTIAELATVAEAGRAPEAAGPAVGVVPLTPIQHWFFDQPLTNPHHFNQSVLLATRQPLQRACLVEAVEAVARAHDAFRLRFTPGPDGWREDHADESATTIQVVSLAGLADHARHDAMVAMSDELQRSLDLAAGPLFRAAYFTDDEQGWLLLAAHHLVIDAVSWRIVLEDLETAYRQLAVGQAIVLPRPISSFQQWAEQLTRYSQTDPLRQEADFWIGRLSGRHARLPLDIASGDDANTVASAAQVAVDLDPETSRALLHEMPQAYHTRVEEVLLTALTQTFTRWTGGQTLLVDLEGHGRADLFPEVDVSRTVGWFTTLFPVALDLPYGTDAGAALQTIKEQLRAIPHKGLGFGVLRYLGKDAKVRQRLLGLPQPQVAFNYLGQFDQQLAGSQLFTLSDAVKAADRSPAQRRSHLLSINAAIVGGALHVEWEYSVNCHRPETVSRLAHEYRDALQDLIAHGQSGQAAGYTPSDFPAAHLGHEELAKLLKQLK